MDRDEAKEYIQQRAKSYLKQDGSRKGFICPVCGSGNGKNGTGITTKDGVHFTCWAGCFTSADIIDIIGLQNGLTDYNSKLRAAADAFNITIDSEYHAPKTGKNQNYNANEQYTQYALHNTQYTTKQEEEAELDYTKFFLQANKDIGKTDYHRGLSLETLNRFFVGYVENWKHPKIADNPAVPSSPRLIIPTSKSSYLARDTRTGLTDEQKKYSKSKVGAVRIFNKEALLTATKPIFIVEGEIDALSIIDVGGEAVGLGSTSNKGALLSMLESQKPSQTLILAMDNDNAGERANKELEDGLNRLAIPFYRLDIAKPYKDANEALNADRAAFTAAVERAEHIQNEEEQAQRKDYFRKSTANYIQSFLNGIADSANTPCTQTGFAKLDGALDGGLYEGLYIVGAISSLGKTTLITQIADQIAQSGHDVLIFSLEMARTELMAKSISRHTLQNILENGGDARNAKTARGITTGKRYSAYSKAEMDLIHNALKDYAEYAKHIYISEGVGDIGAEQVRDAVKKHILFTGEAPVVVIDYLQILAPYSERATDKQNTDKAVMELKRISRDYKTPVIGISSFNRANYKEAVTMEAFKESGAIEYSSDVLIGLQLKGAGAGSFDANEAKKKNPREVELVILKNRNGRTGDKIAFSYYPLFNYFKEE